MINRKTDIKSLIIIKQMHAKTFLVSKVYIKKTISKKFQGVLIIYIVSLLLPFVMTKDNINRNNEISVFLFNTLNKRKKGGRRKRKKREKLVKAALRSPFPLRGQ